MCSPTRACLLTGRNHHTNGLGMISELSQGYPGYDGVILPSRGFLSEILHEKGYAYFAIGKWHLVPVEEGTMSGPFDRWDAASTASTASSVRKPTSSTLTWSMTTTRSKWSRNPASPIT
jgi:arylsulfatase A-like enzyme